MASNPVLSIWIHPRTTVRNLLATDPTRYVLLWAVLAGIEASLSRAAASHPPAPSLPIAIVAVLVTGPLCGLFALWLGSLLVHWTGGWMGGMADGSSLRLAMAWASVPNATALLPWVLRLMVFGPNLLLGSKPDLASDPGMSLFSLALTSVELILALWGTVLVCNTVAEVQGFRSALMGLANVLVAGLLIFVVVAVPLVVLLLMVHSAHGAS